MQYLPCKLDLYATEVGYHYSNYETDENYDPHLEPCPVLYIAIDEDGDEGVEFGYVVLSNEYEDLHLIKSCDMHRWGDWYITNGLPSDDQLAYYKSVAKEKNKEWRKERDERLATAAKP